MWATASSSESGAVRFGQWERRGELKSDQLYGNELWRGWAATNQNVEVLRLIGFQRMQPVNLGSDHISSQAFSAPLNTWQAFDLRQSVHKSFYFVAGRAAWANFDALAGSGVNGS